MNPSSYPQAKPQHQQTLNLKQPNSAAIIAKLQDKTPIHLYGIIMRFQDRLPKQEISLYMTKMFSALIIKNTADMMFFGYGIYAVTCSRRKWFQMTSNPISTMFRMLGFFVGPELFIKAVASQINQSFYKRNKQFLESNLAFDEIGRIDFNNF